MVDCRDTIRSQLLELISQYGSARSLAAQAGTTEQYISMLRNKERYPSLDILIEILRACGYELRIVKSVPSVVDLLRHKDMKANE